MRRISLLITSIFLLSLGMGILAQETELPDPGLTPDSPFYFLDTLGEKIGMFFTFGVEKKAEKAMRYAEEKLAEVKVMAEKNKTTALEKANQKYQGFLGLANQKAQEAKEKGRDVEELAILITEKTLKHQEILVEVFEKVPEEAKTAIEKAIEVARKGSGEAIQVVTRVKKEELQKKAKEIKIKFETADWETYRNEEYGYEVKYPSGWEFEKRSLMPNLGGLDFTTFRSDEDEFSIEIWDFSFYSYNQLTEPPPGGIDPDTIKKKEIIINDQPATELSYVAVGDGGSGARGVKEVFIQKNQLLYKIRGTDSKKCDQILSTFKFIK